MSQVEITGHKCLLGNEGNQLGKWSFIFLFFLSTTFMTIPANAEEDWESEFDYTIEFAPMEEVQLNSETNEPMEHEIHVVDRGDTLWEIAGYYHCDFKELIELNHQIKNPNLIYPKDFIRIPLSRVEGVYLQHR